MQRKAFGFGDFNNLRNIFMQINTSTRNINLTENRSKTFRSQILLKKYSDLVYMISFDLLFFNEAALHYG